nr:uncharacterized protein LOC106678769 isoform X3 [Halyomorpha halys]
MEYSNWVENFQRITVLKKIILSYLEQYMLYHLEQEVNSSMSLKKQLEERNSQENIRSLFRVLSKGLLLNIEQFIKSRKWMNGVSANSIKNITITSINIFPEDQEKKSSISLQQEYASKQISSDSLNIYETINIPEGEFKLGIPFRHS